MENGYQGNYVIFAIIGIAMLVIGFIMLYSDQDYIQTTAFYKNSSYSYTDDDGTTYYEVIYTYKVNEREYEISVNETLTPDSNSTITVKYDPNNPSKNSTMPLWPRLIVIIIGAAALIGSITNSIDSLKTSHFIGGIFTLTLDIALYFICSHLTNSHNIVEFMSNVGISFLAFVVFLFLGVIYLLKGIFISEEKLMEEREKTIEWLEKQKEAENEENGLKVNKY